MSFFAKSSTKKLSSSESYLLDYLEKNINEIPAMSIVKLSEDANVSTATIVRTMKKLGFEGFTSFKHHLKEMEENNPRFSIMEKVDEDIQKAIIKNEQEVTRTIQLLDSGTIEDTVQKLKYAKKVFIFARGFSELIAKEMLVKFQLLDKNCEMHDDPNIIRTIPQKMTTQDIALFISLNGETEELVSAAKNCEHKNISIITITANANGSLAQLSELLFVGYKSAGSYFPEYEVRSRLPLQVISRILLDAYAIRIHQK